MPTKEAKEAGKIVAAYIAHCTDGRPQDADALLNSIDDPVLWRKVALIALKHAAQYFADLAASAGLDPAATAQTLALKVAEWVEEQPDL
jgi:phage tail sheath gpL-like